MLPVQTLSADPWGTVIARAPDKAAWFTVDIDLDYLEDIAQLAQQQYGNEVFSFHVCDVTALDFIQRLQRIMKEKGIADFDVIHMSFLLMHLKDPGAVLASLRSVLAPNGKLIMIEPDDTDSRIEPDPEGQYPEFVEMQLKNPYAGNRFCAKNLPEILSQNGYNSIQLEHSGINAEKGELGKKRMILSVFCSYFPEDIQILRRQEPENLVYLECEEWIHTKYEKLCEKILQEDTRVNMGVKIYTCGLK